jgi:hypothetical protein
MVYGHPCEALAAALAENEGLKERVTALLAALGHFRLEEEAFIDDEEGDGMPTDDITALIGCSREHARRVRALLNS